MENRVANFSAGPAVLPEEVLLTVKENLLNYQSTGLGVMEMSHRGPQFAEIIATAEENLKEILNINDDYAIVFMQGGATTQASCVAMNFATEGRVANYSITGSWAKKAAAEAKKFAEVHIASSSENKNFSYLPESHEISENPAYLHFTSNNTIAGTQFQSEPEVGDVPLICDASSDLLYKKIDVTKYGLIYAGAQKNLGPAGVTVVILRKDLLERIKPGLPVLLDYNILVEKKSLYNTPPTFPIYVVGEVFKWIKKQGGLDEIEKHNIEKANVLYNAIDSSEFYQGIADKEFRSLMNVTFKLSDESKQEQFLKEAEENGLTHLKGHRSVGGLRASIYNACPKSDIEKLTSFMNDFANANG